MDNEMILASAGSGKTYQLTNRFVALMALELLEGRDPVPESILAITFTRKASGEFFQSILEKLAAGAESEEAAAKLAEGAEDSVQRILKRLGKEDYARMLAVFVERMPALFLGTLDAFFASILRSFPMEFGLGGEFEIVDEFQAGRARDRVYQHVFGSSLPEAVRREFLEAFKQATHGREEQKVRELLDDFVGNLHATYLAAPAASQWGKAAAIWPKGTEWSDDGGSDSEDVSRLILSFEASEVSEKVLPFWEELRDEVGTYRPGTDPPLRLKFFLKKFFESWNEILDGEATLTVNRAKQTLSQSECEIVQRLTRRYVAREIELHLKRTAGLREVLARFEAAYASAARRKGSLTFQDVEILLAGHDRHLAAPVLAQLPGEEERLRIDFRLDAIFRHWLLDEFQDTSSQQWDVISNLVDEAVQDDSGDRSLFLVGDTKQAIYGWRGGDVELFRRIRSYYGELIQERPLDVSWRSGPHVIEPLNKVFGDAALMEKGGVPKGSLSRWEWYDHEVATKNRSYPGLTAFWQPKPFEGNRKAGEDECFALTLELLEEMQPVERGLDCVVLVQRNQVARKLVDYIRANTRSRMAVVSEAEVEVATDNPVTLALLELFRLAAHPVDDFSWRHLLGTPLGDVLKSRSKASLAAEVREQVHRGGFEETVRLWSGRLEETGWQGDEFSSRRIEVLAKLARRFDESGSRSLGDFVKFAESSKRGEGETQGAVQVMTIHKAKGLTFDVAILPELGGDLTKLRENVGVQRNENREVEWVFDTPRKDIAEVDKVLKDYRKEREAEAAYEQLCKFYVALTRAKYANYLIAPARGKSQAKADFIKVLETTLAEQSEEKELGGVHYTDAFESGDKRAWWEALENKPKPEKARRKVRQLVAGRRSRPERRMPSDHEESVDVARLLSQTGKDARDFGTEVHALFELIESADRLPKFKSDNEKALAVVKSVLKNKECREELTLAENEEAWCERNFEVMLDGRWVSGTVDRVVVSYDESRKPISARVLDFKTDRVEAELELFEREKHYRKQILTYRQVVARLTGLPLKEVSGCLLFTALPAIVDVGSGLA